MVCDHHKTEQKKSPKKVFLKRKPFIFESDGLWVIFCFKLFFVSNVLRLKDVQGSVNLKIKKKLRVELV